VLVEFVVTDQRTAVDRPRADRVMAGHCCVVVEFSFSFFWSGTGREAVVMR
jgi:hypothetical protein